MIGVSLLKRGLLKPRVLQSKSFLGQIIKSGFIQLVGERESFAFGNNLMGFFLVKMDIQMSSNKSANQG